MAKAKAPRLAAFVSSAVAASRAEVPDSPTPAVAVSESPRDGDAATRRAPETPTAGDAASESPRVAEVETPAAPETPTPPVADLPPPRLRETPRRPLAEVESPRVPESPTHRRPQSPSPAATDLESPRLPDAETSRGADSPTPAVPKWKRLIRKDVHFDAGTLDVLHRETRRIQHARAGIGGERVTESTLVRVMVRAMLGRLPELQGTDEETLLQSLRDAVSRSHRGG